MGVVFRCHCWLVFQQSQQSFGRSALLFAVVNVLAVLQTWLVSMGLVIYALPHMGLTRWVAETAHAVGVVVPVFTSYLGHKHFTFR